MKRLSVFVFALLFGVTSYGQGFDLGLKLGANFSTISDASGLSNKTGFHAGAFGAIKFSDKLAIQGDLLYSQQGAKFSPGDFELDYINVPVVVKYYLIGGLNLQAGPQFGFVVNDNFEDGELESFDLSGVVGAGYDLPFGLRLDARYNFGLTDIVKDSNGKNQVISIALGYSFL
jgi:hypothetical protein